MKRFWCGAINIGFGLFVSGMIVAFLYCVFFAACEANAAKLDATYDAACRVSQDDGVGSGVVFEIGEQEVFVLTNAHVAKSKNVTVEFWRRGFRSVRLPGRVIIRHVRADVAVVAVCKALFRSAVPRAVRLAPRGYRVRVGQTITSVGCAQGTWATGFVGHVTGERGTSIAFQPVIANGRSGSALCDEDGLIIGLIQARWEKPGEECGLALPVENIYRALNLDGMGQHDPQPLLEYVQCGPSKCAPFGRPQDKPPVLPWRQEQQKRDQSQDQRIGGLEQTFPGLVERIDRVEAPPVVPIVPEVASPVEDSTAPGPLAVVLLIIAAVAVGGVLFYVAGKN